MPNSPERDLWADLDAAHESWCHTADGYDPDCNCRAAAIEAVRPLVEQPPEDVRREVDEVGR